MNGKNKLAFLSNGVASLGAALLVLGVLLPDNSVAQTITLSNGGSSATVNVGGGSGNIGMNSWSVLNQNQLNQQWFWYSTDPSQVAQSIDTLGSLQSSHTANQLSVIYGPASGLNIEVDYTLQGGGVGSGNADMMENIYADNYSANPITLNLFEYSNFNLLQSGNNNVTIYPANPGPGYQAVMQTSGGTAIQEAIVSPYANNAEAEPVNQTLDSLTGTNGYNLNNNLSASGDVSWAFQWTVTLNPNDELQIVKDKSLSVQNVPEPSTLAFIAMGIGAWGMARRRRLS